MVLLQHANESVTSRLTQVILFMRCLQKSQQPLQREKRASLPSVVSSIGSSLSQWTRRLHHMLAQDMSLVHLIFQATQKPTGPDVGLLTKSRPLQA